MNRHIIRISIFGLLISALCGCIHSMPEETFITVIFSSDAEQKVNRYHIEGDSAEIAGTPKLAEYLREKRAGETVCLIPWQRESITGKEYHHLVSYLRGKGISVISHERFPLIEIQTESFTCPQEFPGREFNAPEPLARELRVKHVRHVIFDLRSKFITLEELHNWQTAFERNGIKVLSTCFALSSLDFFYDDTGE